MVMTGLPSTPFPSSFSRQLLACNLFHANQPSVISWGDGDVDTESGSGMTGSLRNPPLRLAVPPQTHILSPAYPRRLIPHLLPQVCPSSLFHRPGFQRTPDSTTIEAAEALTLGTPTQLNRSTAPLQRGGIATYAYPLVRTHLRLFSVYLPSISSKS